MLRQKERTGTSKHIMLLCLGKERHSYLTYFSPSDSILEEKKKEGYHHEGELVRQEIRGEKGNIFGW